MADQPEYERVPTSTPGEDEPTPAAVTHSSPSQAAPVNEHTKKADALVVQAEKERSKATSFLGRIFGGGNRLDDVGELYKKAGNLYKVGRSWSKSAEAYLLAADCFIGSESGHEAANCYINAGNVYKKVSVPSAIECYSKAVAFYTDGGRFSVAAKYQNEIGAMYEADMAIEEAINAYQLAGEYFEGEGSQSSANKAYLKVAEFASKLERYARAIEIYERVAATALQNNLTKWGVKDIFFRALLCYMVQGDEVATQRALARYQEMDYTFSNQRECKFVKEIMSAQELQDVVAFTNAVVEYDSITKLGPWHINILSQIKDSIRGTAPSIL